MAMQYLGTGLLRVADVGLATGITAKHLAASVNAIRTSGYSAAGKGAASYVSDALATAGLAAAHPRFCKQSLDGRYWRLLIENGTMDVMQGGALGDNTTDDAAAIQACINYAKTTHGSVPNDGSTFFFPKGTYLIGSSLSLWSGQRMLGEGFISVLKGTGGITSHLVGLEAASVDIFGFGAVQLLGFETAGTVWAIKAVAPTVLNSVFTDLTFNSTYGADLGTYAQACHLARWHSRGNIEQLLKLTGNFNVIEQLDKEGGCGTNTDPLVLLTGALGFVTGNVLRSILLEGSGSANKVPLKLVNATDTKLDSYWMEASNTNGFALHLDASSVMFTGVKELSTNALGKIKLENKSSLVLDEFNASSEDLDWRLYFDISATSTLTIDTLVTRRSSDVIGAADSPNIRLNRVISTNLLSTPVAGYSALSQQDYTSGQNLLVNPSFEAGLHGWALSNGDTPDFLTSEVGQGLMYHCTSTTGHTLTQNVVISAGQVGKPLTMRFVCKVTGSGFVVPVICSDADLGNYQILASVGWQVMSVTYTPSTSGSHSFGVWWVGVSGSSDIYVDEFSLAPGTRALVNPSKFGSLELGQKTFATGTAAPTTGTWKQGDRVFNSAPSSSTPSAWVCTVAGTPGTWAAAGSPDAYVLARANHTGTQTAATISDFTEAAQDVVGALVAAAGGSYNDGAGSITLPGAAGGTLVNNGVTAVNFGAFPGASDASVTITGQTGIVAGSRVKAYLMAKDTADHTADEHWVETLDVMAGNIVPGTGFTIYAKNTGILSEPVIEQWANTRLAGPGTGINQPRPDTSGGKGTRLYGEYTVAWEWI